MRTRPSPANFVKYARSFSALSFPHVLYGRAVLQAITLHPVSLSVEFPDLQNTGFHTLPSVSISKV